MSGDLVFDLSPTQLDFVLCDDNIVQIMGPMGEGKCLARGTPVMMGDGTIKPVERVRLDDQLMGNDSTPRTVLSLGRGVRPLYKITPMRGEPFTVTDNHILSLKRTRTRNKKRGKPYVDQRAGEIVNITVAEFLARSKTFQSIHHLYRVPVEFPRQPVLIDPYWLGLWLGDGENRSPGITTPDPEIIQTCIDYADRLGLKITVNKLKDNKSNTYNMTTGNIGGKPNVLLDYLRTYSLLGNKHIPFAYLANDRETRMAILAGLADSDGYRNRNSYQWTQKDQYLAEDIVYLARSLGFAAFVKPVTKTIKSANFSGTYYQVGVSGDLSDVPVRIDRKRCAPRKPFKDVLVTGIRNIEPMGDGEYYGFTLDGNHLFLLGDFTVTHNTWGGVAGCIKHAERCGKDIRGAVIRDTFMNIKTSTLPDIQDILGPSWCRVSDSGKKLHILTTPKVDLDLFGIDDEASLSKLQGPQYAIIWLEEPAPIMERANAGLPKTVFEMAIARAARQRGTVARVQVTQNPADEDHWTSKLAEEPDGEYSRYEDPETGEVSMITKRSFNILPGENKYLSGLTRAANLAAFRDDPGKLKRYVEGQIASVNRGKKVTPGYNPALHYSQRVLPVLPGELITMWDGWHHPTCVTAQYYPTGQLVVHDVVEDDNLTAVNELCPEKLAPLLNSAKYRGKIQVVRAIGDATMATPDQSTRLHSAAKAVVAFLKKHFRQRNLDFEKGPTSWVMRRESVNSAFKGLIGEGIPKVILSRSAVGLHRALRGGWHYKTDNNGKVVGDKPVKDQYSHPGDGFGHGISVLMPYLPEVRGKPVNPAKGMKTAKSYGPSFIKKRMAVGV